MFVTHTCYTWGVPGTVAQESLLPVAAQLLQTAEPETHTRKDGARCVHRTVMCDARATP